MKKIFAAILLLAFPLTSYGALRFTNGVSQSVIIANSATTQNLNAGTVIMWVKLTDVTPAAQRNFWGKDVGGNRFVGAVSGGGTGGWQMIYAGGTQNANTTVTAANLKNVGANKWIVLAFTWDFGTANNPHLYTGDLTHLIEEVGGYSTQTPGSGTHDDSGAGMTIANASGGGTTNTLPGDVAFFMEWNRVLTLGEIRQQQFRPHVTSGNVVFMNLGFSGLTTQIDWSGRRNSGSITGATLAPHVPLTRLFGI